MSYDEQTSEKRVFRTKALGVSSLCKQAVETLSRTRVSRHRHRSARRRINRRLVLLDSNADGRFQRLHADCSGLEQNRRKHSPCALLQLSFSPLEIHPNNGSEFINSAVFRAIKETFPRCSITRSRPYHKNDNAHAEQKNGAFVRNLFGEIRLDNPTVLPRLERVCELANLRTTTIAKITGQNTRSAQRHHAFALRKSDNARKPTSCLRTTSGAFPRRTFKRPGKRSLLRAQPPNPRLALHGAFAPDFRSRIPKLSVHF